MSGNSREKSDCKSEDRRSARRKKGARKFEGRRGDHYRRKERILERLNRDKRVE